MNYSSIPRSSFIREISESQSGRGTVEVKGISSECAEACRYEIFRRTRFDGGSHKLQVANVSSQQISPRRHSLLTASFSSLILDSRSRRFVTMKPRQI